MIIKKGGINAAFFLEFNRINTVDDLIQSFMKAVLIFPVADDLSYFSYRILLCSFSPMCLPWQSQYQALVLLQLWKNIG